MGVRAVRAVLLLVLADCGNLLALLIEYKNVSQIRHENHLYHVPYY